MRDPARIKVLDRLPDEVYQRVLSLIRWKRYDPDAGIVSYNDRSTDVYFVGSGRVRATMFSASGREVTYQDLLAGEIFGEFSALDGRPRSASVVAVEPSDIGVMSGPAFVELIHRYPEVTDAVMLRLVSVIRMLSNRVYHYDALAVKDRVRKEVLILARQHMTGANTAVIPRMPKHAEIANRIDTHREAVTRELNVLSKMGLIRRSNRELTVTDVAGLAKLLPES